MNRIFASLKALRLSFQKIQKFSPNEVFKSKRIAIVGPADSAFQKENGNYIDQFDYVIRINKAPSSWDKGSEKFIGKNTDIWFHSFFENKESGGGSLDPKIFKNRNIGYIVNPRTTFAAYRRTFNFYRKYNNPILVHHLSSEYYRTLIKKFPKQLRPTVGFIALFSALRSPCKELFITGFTFFKTPYAKGYRDHLIDLEDNKKHFKKQGIHDSNLEYELFKDFLTETKCHKVILDDKLQEIIDSD